MVSQSVIAKLEGSLAASDFAVIAVAGIFKNPIRVYGGGLGKSTKQDSRHRQIPGSSDRSPIMKSELAP